MTRIRSVVFLCTCCLAASAQAAEVTVKNDSLTDFGPAVIVAGFSASERAASWLTSPCNGDIRAVQVFWRSPSGTTGNTIHFGLYIHRAGTFPNPGALAQTIGGPIFTDNALNEFRFLDENSTIPLIVPVTSGETFVIALEFATGITAVDPSVVRDTDGNQTGRNALYAEFPQGTFTWFNSQTLGVNGDWVIRAVIDCAVGPNEADVGVGAMTTPESYTAGQPLSYSIVIDNAGPVSAATVTVVDIFPSAFQSPNWTCIGSGGATCPASGTGNITQNISLPVNGIATFLVNGTVAPGTTGTLTNSVTAVVGGSVTDPQTADNTATVNTSPVPTNPLILADGFEN